MSNSEIQQLQDGLRSARESVLAAIDGITEEEARKVPAEGEWSVVQLLSHIAAIQGFWVSRAVTMTKGDNPLISRSAVENDIRIAAVIDHSGDPLGELKQSMIIACDEAITSIGQIDPADLSSPGRREAGPMTAGDVIQYLAVHVGDHANQIIESRRLIASRE